ncbi:hypothetical protein BDW66DRAFT_51053 [Aspergillus desertorum]
MAQARTSIHGIPRASGVTAQPQALSSQVRCLWGCPHQYHNSNELHRRKHTQLNLHNLHRSRRPNHFPRNQRTIYPDYQYQSWWSPVWGWGWGGFYSSFPESQDKSTRHSGRRNDDNDAWEDRAKRRIEWIRKEVDADPYAAIFGRRIEPLGLNWGNKLESGLASLWRSVFRLGDDMSNNDTDKGAKTIDTMPSIRKDSSHLPVGEEARERVTKDGDIQRRCSTNFRGTGFEFDPVSGRMVPVRSKPWPLPEERSEESQGDGHVGHKSNPVSDVLPREKTEADPHGLSGPNIVDSAIQKDSTVPEATGPSEGASEPSIISKGQIYASALSHKASDCLDETVQPPPNEVRTESQIHAQVERPALPENNGHEILPRDTIQPSQMFEARNHNVSERSMAEQPASEAGLDRAGFLSRRENEAPKSATRTTQPSTAIDNTDEELESLSARDIRAAYEPRRLSIKSEIEAETPEQMQESLLSKTDFEDTYSKSPVGRVEDSVIIPDEPTASTSSDPPDGQFLVEGLSQHEPSITATQPPVTETYRVFAYDPSSAKIAEAETISSLQAPSDHLHPTKVLTRLTNPAKFLPCLNQMHAEGYEIMSGGGDILIFRKAPAENSKMFDSSEVCIHEHSTKSVQPTHEDLYTESLSNRHSSTEQFRKSPQKSKATKMLRRMLVGGLATGGTCYALGVVSKYFRTGGRDGFGIDGFTEFESERRHRER